MSPLREKALKLRLQGHSYNEIHAVLGVPKATQNGWFRHLVLSEAATTRIKARTTQGTINAFVARNKLQTKHAEERAHRNQEEGKRAVSSLSERELRLIGAALYWAEGHKRLQVRDGKKRMAHAIRLVNTDPALIQIFIQFLRTAMGVSHDKIIASMRLYAHINEDIARRYWMNITGLPKQQFRKTTYLVSGASRGVRPHNRLPYGTLEIAVNDTEKFHHIIGLIKGMKEQTGYATMRKLLG